MRTVLSPWLFCVLLLCGADAVGAAPGIDIEKVFGPETRTDPPSEYKHPATITELSNGDLYLAYYGGAGEYAIDTAVFGARLKPGAAQWTHPEPIFTHSSHSRTVGSVTVTMAAIWGHAVMASASWSG